MDATSALMIFPFTRHIHLVRKTETDGILHHWKAEAELYMLRVSEWTGSEELPHHSRISVVVTGWGKCIDTDPVQEMWKQASGMLENNQYRLRSGS